MQYLVKMHYIDTSLDFSQAQHWIGCLAEEVRLRECALRILLDAMLEGTCDYMRRDATSPYDIFIPFYSIIRSSPNRLIIEDAEPEKHGYWIRRKA